MSGDVNVNGGASGAASLSTAAASTVATAPPSVASTSTAVAASGISKGKERHERPDDTLSSEGESDADLLSASVDAEVRFTFLGSSLAF